MAIGDIFIITLKTLTLKNANCIFVFVHFYFCDITDSAIFNFSKVVHQS